ncbi:MAG TPA: hypothetical protein VEU33_22460 [Archangium sp.]|nr:hypothetical protein [Archangium sp.]
MRHDPARHAAGRSKLAWENYPSNETSQPKGSRWVQAAKVAVGGNRLTVKVGFQTDASTTLPAKYCRVAPESTSRPDRNYQVELITDRVNGSSTTDMTTSVNARKPRVGIPDADYSLPPRRMLPSDVGPGAP